MRERRGTAGGTGVTSGERSGTSGDAGVTSGTATARKRLVGLAVFVALAALQASANVFSKIADKRGDGLPVDRFALILDEVSSLVAWFVCLALIWQVVARVRPPRFGWPATLALHAPATVPASLLHVGLMVALREAGHAWAGGDYHFTGDWLGSLVYEYRKDVVTYVLLASFCAVIQWWIRAPASLSEGTGDDILEIGEGARIYRLPLRDLLWAEAAGNYVTLHLADRELLHRTTLAALETTLVARGFVRIHRSRLVRRDAVRAIATGQSGDFTVTLTDDTELRGSRRYRQGLRD